MLNRKIIVLFIFLFSVFTYSQKIIYVDEGMNKIDSLQYFKKCQSITFKCREYITDSIVVNKVLFKYKFGKIKPKEYDQLRKILIIDSGKYIEENATLLIKYYDSLLSFETVYKKRLKHKNEIKELDSIASRKFKINSFLNKYDIKVYNKNKKKWAKKKNKCIKIFEKISNIKVTYLYGYAENKNLGYPNFKWTKDRGLMKNNFFKIMLNYGLLIIKPDGDYFLSGSHITDQQVKQLLKNKDWNDFKENLNSSYNNYSGNSKGFFGNESLGTHHKKHCF